MFKIIHFLLALVIILALAWLVSFDRRKIRIRYVLQLIVIEIALAFFFLHAESGLFLIKYVSGFFESLLKFAGEGTNFVFGGMGEKGLAYHFPWRALPDYFYFRIDWYSPALADPADFYSGYRDAAVKTERYGQAGIV